VLGDRRAEDPFREGGLQSSGGTARATLELVHVLAHDDDPVVGLHPPVHYVGDDVDESTLLDLALVLRALHVAQASQLREVPAYASVDERWIGEELRAVAFGPGLAIRISGSRSRHPCSSSFVR